MHTSKVRVVSLPVAFGGWKGVLSVDGDLVQIKAREGTSELSFDLAQVKRASFNSTNGLWSFRLHDGQRLRFQSAGGLLSADRTDAGEQTNELIHERLSKHGVRVLGA